MQFVYQARDASGHIRNGDVAADSVEAATHQLRKDGLYLLSLEEDTGNREAREFSLLQKRISRSDVIYLTTQLAVMVDAGVPLATALGSLASQADNQTLKSTLEDIQKSVEGGDEFSVALERYPKYFDRTYVNLVKASEASGTLGMMLDRIAVQARRELETRQKVKAAMMYPGAMLVMCIGVSIFLLTYVFPKLTPMFTARQIELPLPTAVMMWLSEALIGYWYLFLLGLAALIGVFLYVRRQHWGRVGFDWLRLHLPILGPLAAKVAIGRNLRTLATTINAGVPMLESIELTANVSNNVFYEDTWHAVGKQVTSGKQIHEALEGNTLFPATLLQMIASGESTGKLGMVLNKVADYFDREVRNSIKAATSLIEPIMVAFMGSVIGLIALAMLLPIFKLSGHAG
jgi:type IV pilus assembly protein PilC